MIDPGELRDIVTIQEYKTTTNENGFEVGDYEVIYALRAKVKTQGTKEYMSADKATTKLTIHVICRARKNIDSDKFLFYDFKRWNIRHVHLMEGRQFMTLTCEVID